MYTFFATLALCLALPCHQLLADDGNVFYFWQNISCMTQKSYSSNGIKFSSFTDFHLQQDKNTTLIFRIYGDYTSIEMNINALPKKVLDCNDRIQIDDKWQDGVNNGSIKCHLIEKIGQKVYNRQVDEVIIVKRKQNGFSYSSSGVSFEFFDDDSHKNGNDLRLDKSRGGIVFYLGQENEQYSFRCYYSDLISYFDLKFSPTEGIIQAKDEEELLSMASEEKNASSISMKREMPVYYSNESLSKANNQVDYEKALFTVEYDDQKIYVPPVIGKKQYQNATKLAARIPESTQNDNNSPYHKVETGETLHYLARKYAISVHDLIKINRLSSTTIREGQELVVR